MIRYIICQVQIQYDTVIGCHRIGSQFGTVFARISCQFVVTKFLLVIMVTLFPDLFVTAE